ncbi:unnamed protein product [Penicillium crustosum]
MNQPTHIIDPDGEVIIILRNADPPFAQALDHMVTGGTLPESGHCLQGPDEAIEPLPEAIEPLPEVIEPPQRLSRKVKMKNKKGKKLRVIRTPPAEPAVEPEPEPAPMEEPEPAEPEPELAEPAPEPAEPEPEPAEPEPEPAEPEPEPAEPEPEPAEPEPEPAEPEPEPAEPEPAVDEEICKPLDGNCFYIQVSAKHLTLASPVFKRILTGGWKESIAYLQKSSVEITADSWDIEAFLVVLHAIHAKNKRIPQKLTLEMLAKVAVIADYYECKESLYIITDIWFNSLEERIPTTYSRDLILWLWVSWFFQRPSQFKESTSNVISCSENHISGWKLPIPDKVIGLINESREQVIAELIAIIYATRAALLSRSKGCSFECSSIMYGALTMQMESVHLLSPTPEAPFPGWNYNDLREKVLSFQSPQWCRFHGYSTYWQSHVCPDSSFTSIFANLDACVQGLDLNSLDSF